MMGSKRKNIFHQPRVSGRKMLALLSLLLVLPVLCLAEDVPSVTGKVLEIEKYGHALLDITIEDFNAAGFDLGDIITVTAGNYTGDMPYFNGYYVDRDEYMVRAYPGQTYIAVCINYGRFADTAGVDVGDPVTLTLKEKAGAIDLQEINNLVYRNDRAAFPSDEVFANFRPVTVGGIVEGLLYRSCSPVNNQYGRAATANALAEAAGIQTVMNLANTEEELTGYFQQEDFSSFYYRQLYEDGQVILLGLGVDFTSEEFARSVVAGLKFLAGQEPPYLVHCTEGKDRAGFASMLLEALMGADEEEIVSDYMLSFTNYYGTEPGSKQYELIADKNIREMLRFVAGLEKGASLEGVDLKAATEKYVLDAGMTQEELDELRNKLSDPDAVGQPEEEQNAA